MAVHPRAGLFRAVSGVFLGLAGHLVIGRLAARTRLGLPGLRTRLALRARLRLPARLTLAGRLHTRLRLRARSRFLTRGRYVLSRQLDRRRTGRLSAPVGLVEQ